MDSKKVQGPTGHKIMFLKCREKHLELRALCLPRPACLFTPTPNVTMLSYGDSSYGNVSC
jgi:hypothetical protein